MLEKDPKNRISAKNALSHEWILKYELSNEKESLESSVKSEKEDQLVSAQENMKRFKEQRLNFWILFNFIIFREIKNLNITGSNSKDSTELIMNSPLITGKTDKIFCMDNMMGSPLINSHDKKYIRKTSDNNISEFHKKVLLKNVSNEKNEIFQFNLMEEEKYNECDDENSPVFDKVQKLHQRNITYKMSIEDGCIKKGSVDVDSPKEIIYKESKALFIEHNKI